MIHSIPPKGLPQRFERTYISRLPPELLSSVFFHGLLPEPIANPTYWELEWRVLYIGRNNLLSLITLVCRHWKDVSYGTRGLWSTIILAYAPRPSDIRRAKAYLERAGGALLDIYIADLNPTPEESSEMRDLWAMLTIRSDQWRTFFISDLFGMGYWAASHLPTSFPNLISAEIQTDDGKDIQLTCPAPRLRNYACIGSNFFPFTAPLLERLSVSVCNPSILPDISQITTLRSIAVDFLDRDEIIPRPLPSPDLPGVTSLMIKAHEYCDQQIEHFLIAFTATNLRHIHISLDQIDHVCHGRGDNPEDHPPIPERSLHFPALEELEFSGNCAIQLRNLFQGIRSNGKVHLQAVFLPLSRNTIREEFEELDEAIRWLEQNAALDWSQRWLGPLDAFNTKYYFSSWEDARVHFQGKCNESAM